MRHRPLLKTLVVSTLLTFAAVPAADANWLGLPGLNGANGASFDFLDVLFWIAVAIGCAALLVFEGHLV